MPDLTHSMSVVTMTPMVGGGTKRQLRSRSGRQCPQKSASCLLFGFSLLTSDSAWISPSGMQCCTLPECDLGPANGPSFGLRCCFYPRLGSWSLQPASSAVGLSIDLLPRLLWPVPFTILYTIIAHPAPPLVPLYITCLLYTSPSPRDGLLSRMPSSA